MDDRYYAHRSEDGRLQTVLEHLEGTAKRCGAFAAAFGAEEQGTLAGMAHDIGKFSKEFQKRLLENGPRVDHATAGAFECRSQSPLVFCIAGHHSGLPDMGGKTDIDSSTLWSRLNGAQQGKLADCSAWKEEVVLPNGGVPPVDVTTPDKINFDFYVRMLYSCLTDADYLNTEEFMSDGRIERESGEPLSVLCEKLNAYTDRWFPPQSELNVQRCAILEQCKAAGCDEGTKPGVFTLTVPTGGGKTIASLAFALQHAVTHGMSRVVYVIPYTSIIEQTAGTFREILGAENVLEHHSGVLFDNTEEANIQSQKLARATENWDMPVIVTTAVQFFESIYGNRSSSSRKLHNLANSVIIFDEAQMLPVPYLKPCVSAVSQLTAHYGASAVLCTATQPALNEIFMEYLPENPIKELCPASVYDPSAFQRVSFQKEGMLSWNTIAERMKEATQALCIVNTRKSAKALFDLLENENCFHLSTLMVPAHRRQILDEIRSRLSEGEPCCVVSTSLIEAGVDVDFPAVFREMSGLDSVLQAAGRCNREGKRQADESIVTVFTSETNVPELFRLNRDVACEVMEEVGDFSSTEAIELYFRKLRYLVGEKQQDKNEIMELMKKYAFAAIAKKFHLIEENTRTVYIPWGEKGQNLIRRLHFGERNRALFREAGQYGVSLYQRDFAALADAGYIQPIGDNGEELWALTDMEMYSDKTGLSVKAETGQAYFI